jgi:hypothetical protein
MAVENIQSVQEGIGQVFFYLNRTNDLVTRLYQLEDGEHRHRLEYELTQQEEYLERWAKKLVAAAGGTEPDDFHLDMLLASIALFNAERRYHIWNNRGDSPEGAEVLDNLSEPKSLDELQRIFNTVSLQEFAKGRGISLEDAAALQILVRHRLEQEEAACSDGFRCR